MIAISSAVSSSMSSMSAGIVARPAMLRRAPAALAGDQLVAVRRRAAGRGSAAGRRARGSTRPARRASPRRRRAAAAPGSARCGRPGCSGRRRRVARVSGRQQADDGRGELALLGQATRGGGAEIRSGQGRPPPERARGTCAPRPMLPAYDVIGRPTSGASPSFTVLRTMLLKTWWSPTTRSSSSMSRARFVRPS